MSVLQSFVLEEGGQAELWVCYDPAHYCDQMSQIIDEVPTMPFPFHFLFKSDATIDTTDFLSSRCLKSITRDTHSKI